MLNEILKTLTEIKTNDAAINPEIQYLGIDNGSTGIRSCILLENPSADKTIENIDLEKLELDHRYAEVDIDDEIDLLPVTAHDVLEDKLELIIENFYPDGYIDYCHILRGKMAVNLGKTSPRLISAVSKVQQRQTYVNILSSIAITLLSKVAITSTSFSSAVDIDLSVTLPPEDMIIEDTAVIFKQRLKGQYKVKFPMMDYVLHFNIPEENIHVLSEPYAVGNALPRQDVAFEREVVCDIGGRSTGCILVTNGRVNRKFQTTSMLCGQDLVKILTRLINRNLNLSISEREITPEIFSTGILYYNATSYDVVDLINKAKTLFARKIFDMYLGFLDESGELVTNINKITFAGRVFTEIESNGEIVSPSMLYKLRREINELSPNTKVELFSLEYPILTGLMRERLQNI